MFHLVTTPRRPRLRWAPLGRVRASRKGFLIAWAITTAADLTVIFSEVRLKSLSAVLLSICLEASRLPSETSNQRWDFFFFLCVCGMNSSVCRAFSLFVSIKRSPPPSPPSSFLAPITVTSVPLHHCHTRNHSKCVLRLYCSCCRSLLPQRATSPSFYLHAEECTTWKTGLFAD